MLRQIALNLDRGLEIYTSRCKRYPTDYFSLSKFAYKHYGKAFVMPRKNNKSQNSPKGNGKNDSLPIWINIRLDGESISELLDVYPDHDSILNDLATYFVDGYDLSVSYKSERSNFSCYIGGAYLPDDGNIYKIASYAPDAITAVGVCLYKLRLFLQNPDDFKGGAEKMALG